MKLTKIFNLITAIAMIGLFVTACSKDEKDKDEIPDSSSIQQLVKDEIIIESSFEDAINDANEVLSNGTLKDLQTLPTTVIDTIGDTITYTITFNNSLNHAGTKIKTGKLIIKRNLTTPWSAVGTTVSIRFDSLKIIKVSNSNWVMFNGTKVWTNVSGGLIKNLAGSGSVVHTITGSVQASFVDNTTRTWNVARKLTYSGNYSTNELELSLEGLGSAGGYGNLVVWGTNRHNENFYTQITQAVVLKQSCSWDPVSGIKVHQIPSDNKSATITFGFNSNNQPITGNTCPTRLKVDWVKGSYSGTLFLDLP